MSSPDPKDSLLRTLNLLRRPTFWLSGRITPHKASQINSWLAIQIKPRLTIVLNSQGGSVVAAFDIHQAIKKASLEADIRVLTTKECLSAATIVLCSVDKSKRTALRATRFYTHSIAAVHTNGVHIPCQSVLSPEEIDAESQRFGVDLRQAYHYQRRFTRLYVESVQLSPVQAWNLLSPDGISFSARKARQLGFVGHIAWPGDSLVIRCAEAYLRRRRRLQADT